ncbi:MAG: prepilin-type N-terminal cleavage/methylation domain-containing protein [Phycisphaerales bacterium]|nr:prepilin-type N-terminal cleavage/methylation domain-containing protein [Phycisphaerales bacterium]
MRQAPTTTRRGFSLVELLVVIMVITVIISIIVPALGYARNSAKVSSSRQLVGTVTQAIAAFELSERRTPGVFTPTEMGSPTPRQGGLSAMQNMILDMAGGWQDAAGADPTYTIRVNPSENDGKAIMVNPSLIGQGKGYFVPPGKSFIAQDGTVGGAKTNGNGALLTSTPGIDAIEDIPELVDAFGTPILAWQSDPISRQPIAAMTAFARENAGPANSPTLSRFYWQSNRCLLENQPVGVGARRIKQHEESILGSNFSNRYISMAGILGNPSSPVDVTQTYQNILPSGARGSVIIHAAGSDATYLGIKDRGGKLAASAGSSTNPLLYYGLSFKAPGTGAPYTDASGRPTTIDLVAEFDDIVSAAGSSN